MTKIKFDWKVCDERNGKVYRWKDTTYLVFKTLKEGKLVFLLASINKEFDSEQQLAKFIEDNPNHNRTKRYTGGMIF